MIELEQEDILYETEYDPFTLEQEQQEESEAFPQDLIANSHSAVRFDRIPDESRAAAVPGESTLSTDLLHVYYRSMSKIPLLTREQEVILAKKIESAKLNILHLLSLTPIASSKIISMANELQPAGKREPDSQSGIEEKREAESEIPLERILEAVASFYSLKPSQLKSKGNSRPIAVPRQVAMYICKALRKESLPQIGRDFGGKHHTTVLHSIRKIDSLRQKDSKISAAVNTIMKSLR